MNELLEDVRYDSTPWWGWGYALALLGLLFNIWSAMLFGGLLLTIALLAEAGSENDWSFNDQEGSSSVEG